MISYGAKLSQGYVGRFLARDVIYRDVIYTSRAYATMSVSVCLSVCLWWKCIGALYS